VEIDECFVIGGCGRHAGDRDVGGRHVRVRGEWNGKGGREGLRIGNEDRGVGMGVTILAGRQS
jgi:hypothetical protein